MQADGERPHISWDEETIAQHDAERGTRMKIEEPKTPYHYYADSDGRSHDGKSDDDDDDAGERSPRQSLSGRDQGLEWKELQVKLERVQDQKRHSEWDTSDEEADDTRTFAERDADGKKLVKDPKFAEKRKLHYNEFERVKMWRQTHQNEEGDDDDDDESDDAKEQASTGTKMQ